MHLLDKRQAFSKSKIWQLQRDYYESTGIDAWSSDTVPHYITSNPVAGKTYAELVLAFLRDLSLRGQQKESVYLLELGAGHGRLCYHFFKHFEKLYNHSAIALPPFCYILSDFTESALDFWETHTHLQTYLKKGWLDYAHFDAETSSNIQLEYAKKTINKKTLAQPLLVIGNYFFDSIPQDLFRIENQHIAHSLLTLTTEHDPAKMTPAALLEALKITYEYEDTPSPIYKNNQLLNQLIEAYRTEQLDTHLLFPHVGILCLERLRALSQQGLVVLTADKGRHLLADLNHCPAPELMIHGSFSLTVNYHAFQQYCTLQGGTALFPRYQQDRLDLGCLLLIEDAANYRETINAYERFVNDYGPDDYFCLKKFMEQHYDTMTYRGIMATLRLSGYDALLFQEMLPQLMTHVPALSQRNRSNLFITIHRIWETYYPIGEKKDLALSLGVLLYHLHFYEEAIVYFEKSIVIYGRHPLTLFNMVLSYYNLKDFDKSEAILRELLKDAPKNKTYLKFLRMLEVEQD